jgi:carbonic anhydrase
MGNLTTLLSKLQPAVSLETLTPVDRNSSNSVFVENVAKINVEEAVGEIQRKSPILKDMIDTGEIGICGAMYNVETGQVEFYEHTLRLN